MKYSVIVPTYHLHIKEINRFLNSFNEFCEDKDLVVIRLIISEDDIPNFSIIRSKWDKTLNIEIITLKQLVQAIDNIEIDEKSYLERVGKFNFQSLKKIYGSFYYKSEVTLVLDSEALIIRRCNFAELFKNYMSNPFIIYSKPQNKFQNEIISNCSQIIGNKSDKLWFFEYQYWFFQYDLVDAFFKYLREKTGKSLFYLFQEYGPVFEYQLYAQWLYQNNYYNYKFIDAKVLLKSYLNETQYFDYEKLVEKNGTSLFEYISWNINDDNFSNLKKIFSDLNLRFFKYDDRHLIEENILCQRKFIEVSDSLFLLPCYVSSEDFKLGIGVTISRNYVPGPNIEIDLNIFEKIIKKFKKHVRPLKCFLIQKFWHIKYYYLLYTGNSKKSVLKTINTGKSAENFALDANMAFDVGAFIGNSIPRIRSLGYNQIICIEPDIFNFEMLHSSFKNDNEIILVNNALSEKSNNVISYNKNISLPWLNTFNSDWIKMGRHVDLFSNYISLSATTITLDDLIIQIGKIPHYIKIDVEGFELNVLKGLTFKPSIISVEWISENHRNNILVVNTLKAMGYEKYILCMEEDSPNVDFGFLSHNRLIETLEAIYFEDFENLCWGNIFCYLEKFEIPK
jgi:FkbM family methyltransferase